MLTEPRSFLSSQSIPASEFLREKCPVPSNATIKDFARWYCKSRSGRLTPEPNLVSVTNTLKKNFDDFEQVTEVISQKLRNDVYFVSAALG
jgi:hypothetical protein